MGFPRQQQCSGHNDQTISKILASRCDLLEEPAQAFNTVDFSGPRSNHMDFVSCIHTVGRQRSPLRQVSQPHPRWATGVASAPSRFSEGLRTTLNCFQLLTGKTRMQLRFPSNADACSQGSARLHICCHEKDCNSHTSSPGKIPRPPILA